MAVRKIRVFIVEDHPATARGLKMFLEVSGYAVEIAHSVESALRAAKTSKFDILLCDLNLRDGTGWELMERLSARQPVIGIAYSAFQEPEHMARSKAAGFVDHVVKGATPEALVSAIDRAARGRDVRGGRSAARGRSTNGAAPL
jgi:CheY-like chemotaxis protein